MFRITNRTSRASSRGATWNRAFRALGLLFLGLLTACASSPNSTKESVNSTPARVRFMDYRQGTVFELVNEAHTDRVALYSEVRSNTTTKVTNNEVMSALLDYLDSSGFERHARRGIAPRTSSTLRWGGEIETGGGSIYMVVDDNSPLDQRKIFLDCYMNHVTLWSNIFQLQRVDAGPDEVFKKPELRR